MKYLLYATFLGGTLVMAQPTQAPFQQRTTGVVGLTSGQTARLTILYPTVPSFFLQVTCGANMLIQSEDGSIFASKSVQALVAGNSLSLEISADSVPGHAGPFRIHGNSIASNGCHLLTTLEIVDNATQKTVVVLSGESTYPPTSAPVSPVVVGSPAQ